MDEPPSTPQSAETETENFTRVTSITRGADWRRMSADTALFFALGHDAEIAFTAGGPNPVELKATETSDGEEIDKSYRLQSVIEEVARVRMPPVAATALAFNIIARQASSGLFEKEKLRVQFHEILDLIEPPEVDEIDE